jgi:tetratricopeptide (TPR) repeat protein
MFTINIYLRFALIALFLGGGVLLAFLFGFWYAFPLLLIGILLFVGYVLFGTIQSAAALMQTMDFDKTEKRLNLTLTPRWLYPTNRAYYYMIKGSIATARKDVEAGEMWLRKAQGIKLPSENEKAMLELQLANIMASRNKWQQAQLHFRNAKKYRVTEPAIKEQLNQFEKALSNRGQLKAAGGQKGGMMAKMSGKRRRPKMR